MTLISRKIRYASVYLINFLKVSRYTDFFCVCVALWEERGHSHWRLAPSPSSDCWCGRTSFNNGDIGFSPQLNCSCLSLLSLSYSYCDGRLSRRKGTPIDTHLFQHIPLTSPLRYCKYFLVLGVIVVSWPKLVTINIVNLMITIKNFS